MNLINIVSMKLAFIVMALSAINIDASNVSTISDNNQIQKNNNVEELVYLDESRPLEVRVEDALRRMSLEEKVYILHAQSKFSSPGVPRLGIPELWMTDGPHGIRPEVLWDEWNQAGWTNDSCVAFPSLTCLAATWDRDMSYLYGKNIGEEARFRKKSVLLGPGVNIYRTPLNGRNFEYMGEDPYLASEMVVPYIKGVQSNGVAACVKHFALNNHEVNRNNTNVIVDDRTLHEIYLPAFKAAVIEGKVWSIMGSYNLYKKQHCTYNEHLINDILKGDWGFDGAVISDWGAVHNTDQAIKGGLDLEFGSWTDGLTWGASNAYDNYYLAAPYLDKLKKGETSVEILNDKVRRVLRLIFRTEMNRNRPIGAMCSESHYSAARKIASDGIVLLKNDNNVLPINFEKVKNILVVGENAIKMMTVGGGSSSLKVQKEVSPLEGIKRKVGNNVNVSFARGYVGDVSSEYNGVVSGQDLKDDRSDEELEKEAVILAKQADYVIFVGGLNKSEGQDCEGADRTDMSLPYNQDKLISALASVNKKLVVVNISGNAVGMPWVDDVPAILQAWYLGSETGNAIADVISGDITPSGKLPFTFPKKLEDVPAHILGDYSGTATRDTIDIKYNEGIFVGYRWVDMKRQKPLFAFGHGLSYTSFKYSDINIDRKVLSENDTLKLSVTVTNTGKFKGKEIVQLYIGDTESSVKRPVKELKGFEKVSLAPGESKTVVFLIKKDDLCFFDPQKQGWTAEHGKFYAFVASSSDNIRGKVSFELQ